MLIDDGSGEEARTNAHFTLGGSLMELLFHEESFLKKTFAALMETFELGHLNIA